MLQAQHDERGCLFVFCGHEASYPGHARAVEWAVEKAQEEGDRGLKFNWLPIRQRNGSLHYGG